MPRVLLVDDDPAGLDPRRMILERAGYRVSMATTGAEARARMAEGPPEIVIMDLRLPEAEDGLALIRDFRGFSPAVRIVVLAGWPADLDGRPEATMVQAVLKKPVRSERLLATLAS